MRRPLLSTSPVASAFASATGSCSCGTTTVVTSRTRSVQAASAPSSVIESGLSNAMRSPQHSDENGPSSITFAQVLRVTASRSGSMTGIVIPTRTSAILARGVAGRHRDRLIRGLTPPSSRGNAVLPGRGSPIGWWHGRNHVQCPRHCRSGARTPTALPPYRHRADGIDAHRRLPGDRVVLDSPVHLRHGDLLDSSIIGFLLAAVVFVYLMRGVEWIERVRSEAVFGLQIPVPARALSHYTGFQRWAHQLWLDISSARFWKAAGQHYLRMTYDLLVTGLAVALLAFAFLGPAAAMAVQRSDDDAGLQFISPALAWLLAVFALAAAVAILIFAPAVDARIDRWLLAASPTAALQHEVSALSQARAGAVTSAQTERHRIERDLHDSVQPRLVSLAMTIGLAQTKLDNDLPTARKLISEAHGDAR